MVAEVVGYWSRKIRQAVDVVYVLHVAPIQQVEELDAGFSLDSLGEGDHTLYPQIGVIVAGSIAHAIGERETVTVGVKACNDAEKPRALQTGKDGKFEVSPHDRPLLGRFGQECERKTMADVIVADGAIKFGV